MTYTFRQACNQAVRAKKEVAALVSIPSDFKSIPWFKIGITPEQGKQLLKDSYNYQSQIEQIEDRPDKAGLKIKGVWFYWDKQAEAA